MRNIAFVLALFVSVAALGAQDPPAEKKSKNKLPEKGSTITVRGCVTGSSSLQDDETGLVYRLKGDKAVLKDLAKEHTGHVDELTGILQSSLLMAGTKSKRVGNTTISIGAAESRNSGPRELNPIFEVKSVKHLQAVCTK
jgi:hypothetical protein